MVRLGRERSITIRIRSTSVNPECFLTCFLSGEPMASIGFTVQKRFNLAKPLGQEYIFSIGIDFGVESKP